MPQVSCATCRKRFAWKPALAGRRVRCKCGAAFEFPSIQPTPDAGYDVETPQPPVTAPSPPMARKALAKPKEDELEPIKNFWMPIWLIVGSVVIDLVMSPWTARQGGHTSLLEIGISILASVAVMLPAVLLAAKFRGIRMGPLGAALLKLAAVSVAPGAALALASPVINVIPFGSLIGAVAAFVLYFALLGALFDLDESDTWYLICVIFVLGVGLYFAQQWLSR